MQLSVGNNITKKTERFKCHLNRSVLMEEPNGLDALLFNGYFRTDIYFLSKYLNSFVNFL